jgi:hypothetical protein
VFWILSTAANVRHTNFFIFWVAQLEDHDVDVEGEQQSFAELSAVHEFYQSFYRVSLKSIFYLSREN